MKIKLTVCILVVVLVSFSALFAGAGEGKTSADLSFLKNETHGLCAVIGSGSDNVDKIANTLGKTGNFIVHGIALSSEDLKKARASIAKAGLDGYVSLEQLSVSPLPYRDNLVNFLIVADGKRARKAGLTEKEAMRVLAPYGKLCVYRNSKWEITEKPMPAGMDDWTHNYYDSGNSKESKDKVFELPIGYRWHAGLSGKNLGVTLNNGRVYTVSSSVYENLDKSVQSPSAYYLTARDAFNGMLLWRRKIGAAASNGAAALYNRLRPQVSIDDRVYVVSDDGKMVSFDGATGEVKQKMLTQYRPSNFVVHDGVLVVSTAKIPKSAVESPDAARRRGQEPPPEVGAIEAWSVQTGKRIWSCPQVAVTMLVNDGRVYFVSKNKSYAVKALDLKTGKSLWEVDAASLNAGSKYVSLDAASCNVVAVNIHSVAGKNMMAKDSWSGFKPNTTALLSGKDGKILLSRRAVGFTGFHNGEVNIDESKYDPATGKKIGSSDFVLDTFQHNCAMKYYVNGITLANRWGQFFEGGPVRTDQEPGDLVKETQYAGVRASCASGSIPAYGALFTPPTGQCACDQAQINGFIACGPIGAVPSKERMEAGPKLIKGDAYGEQKGKTQYASSWPMYRHDAYRGNSVEMKVSESLKPEWETKIAPALINGVVERDWLERLTCPVSAPVVSEGVVVSSLIDRNQIVALSEKTGKEIWRFTAGGRVDTPPTLYNGICLFGSRDGYVYALDLKNGALCWKMRAAPGDERMVSFGKVESVWPVIGSILVDKGVAYASAGRSQESDGGIVIHAFKPETGKVIWSSVTPSEMYKPYHRDFADVYSDSGRWMSINDIMIKYDDIIQLTKYRFDPKNGERKINWLVEIQRDNRHRDLWPRANDSGRKEWEGKEHAARQMALLKNKKNKKEIVPYVDQRGYIDQSWMHYGMHRTYQTGMGYGNVRGLTTSWNKDLVCTLKDFNSIKAVHRNRLSHSVFNDLNHGLHLTDPVGKKDVAWDARLPNDYKVNSVVLSDNCCAVGGSIAGPDGRPGKGFITLLSAKDGKEIAKKTFDTPLAFNGLAAANSRLVSTFADGTVIRFGKN